MKKNTLFILLIFLSVTIFAQRPDRSKMIKAKKISFITERLDLTAKEAEVFWPLYNAYEKERRKLFKQEKLEIKSKIKSAGGVDNISNEEAIKYLETLYKIKGAHYKIKTNFYNSLMEVLPAKKVLKLEILEHRFNKFMIDRFKERRRRRKN